MPHNQLGLFFRVTTSSSVVPAWLRQVLYTDPLKRFVPERVVMRICDAPDPLLSAPGFDVDTVISSTESIIGRMYMKKPSVFDRLSWTFTPSRVMFIEDGGRPLTVELRVTPAGVS